ncbi:HAMP domain-containing sensor histidine kinase [Cohnella nanjingensis]|uniref:histidine kinase n=1 Tax=Cohnella nanjingensis TaxID=1387779 RepID=A0A7X0VFS2_9BACL|nr:HAMP domain-containing sensor histidine kinase [Cohnella nanjingensis]MBB6672116.1 HAMP domain-containing histidine kinase [Cohnella nanjingensis]
MKFWQKICLFSILAFVIVFNAASIMVIERNHSKLLQQVIDNTLSEHMNILSSVDAVVPVLRIYDSLDYEKTVLSNIASTFVARSGDATNYLEITNAAQGVVYSNLDFAMPDVRPELTGLTTDETKYILRDLGHRTLLFTTNKKIVNDKDYVFTYIKDVTSLYAERVDQYQFFVKVDIGACLLYVLAMYFISRGLTKPIDHMVGTARIIAKGGFSERVALKSKDELGVLASNFNEMAAVVEGKINELELNNSEKQRFINNIAHELKTPLTSIIGYSNYLRLTKYDEATFLDGLQVIYSEAKRLEALSTKLMDLILLRRDEFRLAPGRLSAVLEEMEPALAMRAKEKRIQVLISAEGGELPMDEDLIKILVFNLADNAIKASPEGGRIEIRAYRDGGSVVLEVSDDGIGIAPEHLERIFEPFYMADKSRTSSREGAGLGLSICKSIAEIHHAAMEAVSTESAGTTIRVIFGEPHESRWGVEA